MAKIKFNSIPGTVGRETDNHLTYAISGSKDALSKIKKILTVRNKSAGWAVMKAKENLIYWSRFNPDNMVDESREKLLAKLKQCRDIIAENEPLMVQELFEDCDGYLEIPIGFHWLAEIIEGNFHLNTKIKPLYLSYLRDYQKECLTEMLKYKRATGVLATGMGKTAVISSLCVSAVASGLRVCIAVPTDYLVGQIFDTVSKFVNNVKAYGGKRKALPMGADVLVITAQSAMKFIGSYDVVIIDESQHSGAMTWVNLLTESEKTKYVYNFTATPFRGDGMDMMIHSFGGPTVYEKNARWGIENGWLKPLKVFVSSVSARRPDGSNIVLSDSTTMASAYKQLVQNKTTLLYIKNMAERALAKGRRVIVLFKTISAGEEFKKVCKKDLKFDVATSKWKKPIDDFKDGICNILVSNDRLLSEGLDVPNADVLINCLQNSSPVITFQATGRILRKTEGDALVIDIQLSGYRQFAKSQEKRIETYSEITDSISLLTT
jgi:superfamily II DNA or RNA helicase